MKIKTSELTGAALDWAVAKATGERRVQVDALRKPIMLRGGVFTDARFSNDWSQTGPLLEKHGIWLSDDNDESPEKWIASVGGVHLQTGPTPLIAAMRALVASKLGHEIEVPDELAQQTQREG